MLTNQTPDIRTLRTDPVEAASNNDPFHIFTYQERLKYAFERPLQFAPGTELELLPYELHDLGEDPVDDRQGALKRAFAKRKVLAPDGL